MPPFIGRKRGRTPDDAPDTPPATAKTAKGKQLITKNKKTEAEANESKKAKALARANQKFIEQLSSSTSEASLSDADSEDFEDVLPAKKQKVKHEASDDEADWEDALTTNQSTSSAPAPSGDLELTLNKSQTFETLALTDGTKKGPSKIERQIRINTHRMHVQCLMVHNLIRNGWACDPQAQGILKQQLPPTFVERIRNWREASGLMDQPPKDTSPPKKQKGKSAKGKGKAEPRKQRDWGTPAKRQAANASEAGHGDPLPRLLKDLVQYWKRTFRVVTPSLRKQGYKPISTLQEEMSSFNNEPHDAEKHGERVRGRSDFRRCAKLMEGSRDTGVQLFLCLLRGLGIEARFVANLQPTGFGWSKGEEAKVEKTKQRAMNSDDELSFSSEDDNTVISDTRSQATASTKSAVQTPSTTVSAASTPKIATSKLPKATPVSKGKAARRQPKRGAKEQPISLDSDEHFSEGSESSELSDAQSISSGASLEILETNTIPRRKPNIPFDRGLAFPNSWIEAISPISHRVIPVDAVVTHTVAIREDDLVVFEPRGKKAENAKQVMAYVIAYNSDGTAKEVTTRYLKRHQWPGRTKGMRITAEKVPIYNRRGKVKRYVHYDWFKTVLRGYARPQDQRTVVDDIEEQTDLKPMEIAKKAVAKSADEIDTLAGYKASAEFVLERHLRVNEALVPNAEPVRYFKPTPGSKKTKASTKDDAEPEPVYKRSDVVAVKTSESWHKEGRGIIAGAQPLKTSKIRAVTLQRQREIEEATRTHGVAPTQGLYSWDQTDWIIPPPIQNGVIPKNSYGSMDVFVSSMVPEGAAHVPWRGAVKAAKKLGCDFAEAVTGFEFGNRRAVPVIHGVIVPVEYEAAMIEEIQRMEEEKRIREEGKRAKAALGMWRKFVMGLRIIERVREEYGPEEHGAEERNPFLARKADQDSQPSKPSKKKQAAKASKAAAKKKKEDLEVSDEGGGFIAEDGAEDEGGGGFLIEENPAADDPPDGDEEAESEDEGEGEDEAESQEDGEDDEDHEESELSEPESSEEEGGDSDYAG